MKLSKSEIEIIIDHLEGRKVISRRKNYEQFSSGRGKILHRHVLLYSALVRELGKKLNRLKVELVDEGNDELVLILEDPTIDYRRETRIPREIAEYLVNKFPQIARSTSICSPALPNCNNIEVSDSKGGNTDLHDDKSQLSKR